MVDQLIDGKRVRRLAPSEDPEFEAQSATPISPIELAEALSYEEERYALNQRRLNPAARHRLRCLPLARPATTNCIRRPETKDVGP